MEERNIVAIDLGASSMKIAVARQEGKNLQVVYYKEHESEGIDQSAVLNETRAASVLSTAIKQAEASTGVKISRAVVGMPRYNISQQTRQAYLKRDEDTCISEEEVHDLMNIARNDCQNELEDPETFAVYDALAQSYSDGEQFQIREEDIIGLEREGFEGNFKVFIGKRKSLKRIDSVLNKVEVIPAAKFFTADSTARAVLSNAEMETGVALVELGGSVTSVSIYLDGIMRYFASIPFGGKTVTSDIRQECGISAKLAENIKKAYGVCMPAKLQNLGEKKLQIRSHNGNDKQIPLKVLSEIMTARMAEIIDAILYHIQESGLADELRAGIVLTGGGAETGSICTFFQELSGYPTKIGYPERNFSISSGCEAIQNTSAATIVGMILSAMKNTTCEYTGAPEPKMPEFTVKPQQPEPKTIKDIWDETEALKKPEEPKKPEKQKPATKGKDSPWWRSGSGKGTSGQKTNSDSDSKQTTKNDSKTATKQEKDTDERSGGLSALVRTLFDENENETI